MLTLTGTCLGTKSETVDGPRGSFISTEFAIQTGDGFDQRVERVRESRDFRVSDRPADGEVVTLAVAVSAYAGRNGAGYRLTALSRVYEGTRALADA